MLNQLNKILSSIKDSLLLKNIGANMIFHSFSMILSFVYVPISRAYLGDVRYGVWATISSIVSWLAISDIGIGNGLRNRLTETLASGRKEDSKQLMSTAYFIMFWICTGLFCIYLSFAHFFDISGILNLNIENENTNLALTITVAFMSINLWLGLVSQVFYAVQLPAVITISGTILQLLNIILIILATKLFVVNLCLFALLLGFSGLIRNVGLSIFAFSKYPELFPKIRLYKKKYAKSIASVGLALFIGQICSTVTTSTDNILISKLFGAVDVTPYSTAYKLFQLFIQVHGLIIMPLWSAFTLKKEQKNFIWIKKTLKRMNQFTAIISIGVIIAVLLIPYISDLWLQHHLEYDRMMLIIMGFYVISYMYASNYASLLCGVNNVKFYTICAAVGAIINIPTSIILAKYMKLGLGGIIGGTLVSNLISLIVLPIESRKWLKQNLDKIEAR